MQIAYARNASYHFLFVAHPAADDRAIGLLLVEISQVHARRPGVHYNGIAVSRDHLRIFNVFMRF